MARLANSASQLIRQGIISGLVELAVSLGTKAEDTEWYLFGSADRDELDAADIDLIILCKDDVHADLLRIAIDPDAFLLPLHLSLMTFDEAVEINVVSLQLGSLIFP